MSQDNNDMGLIDNSNSQSSVKKGANSQPNGAVKLSVLKHSNVGNDKK